MKEAVCAADFTDDDERLQALIDAAEVAIARYLRRDIAAEFSAGLPADIQQAVKLLVALWYGPETEVGADWPIGVYRLLAPFRGFA